VIKTPWQKTDHMLSDARQRYPLWGMFPNCTPRFRRREPCMRVEWAREGGNARRKFMVNQRPTANAQQPMPNKMVGWKFLFGYLDIKTLEKPDWACVITRPDL
jgi:hypothetical protein